LSLVVLGLATTLSVLFVWSFRTEADDQLYGPCADNVQSIACYTCGTTDNNYQCWNSAEPIDQYTPNQGCANLNPESPCNTEFYDCGDRYDCGTHPMPDGECSQSVQCFSP
jgi:hypothetical protein